MKTSLVQTLLELQNSKIYGVVSMQLRKLSLDLRQPTEDTGGWYCCTRAIGQLKESGIAVGGFSESSRRRRRKPEQTDGNCQWAGGWVMGAVGQGQGWGVGAGRNNASRHGNSHGSNWTGFQTAALIAVGVAGWGWRSSAASCSIENQTHGPGEWWESSPTRKFSASLASQQRVCALLLGQRGQFRGKANQRKIR